MSESLRPRLVVLQGNQTLGAKEIPAGEEWKLGRQAESPLPLQERSISRVHVRVFCDDAGVHLEDLGSPNGTFIDGRPVTGTVTLRDGNMIRLGQSTNPDPILLRFEDPGTRLLEAMAELVPPAAPAPNEPTVVTTAPATVSSAGAVVEPATEPTTGEIPAVAPSRKKATAGGTIAAILAALGVTVWLVLALRATQKPWQSVKVEPLKITGGGRVSLRGSEVEPSDTLKVLIDDKAATIEEMAPGQLVFTAPVQEESEAGVRPVSLKVERRGIVVLRQNLQYETLPRIESAEPGLAAVGGIVTLKGSGFLSDVARIKIKVGQQPAAVRAATPRQIQFQVPVVTRSVTVELPLEVQVGEWSTPPRTLQVRPRESPCFAMALTGRSVADRVWEVRHPLGPALYVEGPAGDTAPPAVERAREVIAQAFAKAVSDPSVHFEVRGPGRNAALVAVGLERNPVEVARWSPALVAFLKERAPDLRQTELAPYWSSVVLNELLNVFAKHQPPRLLPADDPVRAALKRLQDLNVETGGQGCPSAEEVQTVRASERDAFETAAARLPAGFGDVAGNWEGTLENVFAEKATETTLELRLELEQTGTEVKGRALVYEVRGPGIRWSPPPVEGLAGSVKLGAETRIDLVATPTPPYYFTKFTSVLADGTLVGSFRTSKNKQGKFALQLKAAE